MAKFRRYGDPQLDWLVREIRLETQASHAAGYDRTERLRWLNADLQRLYPGAEVVLPESGFAYALVPEGAPEAPAAKASREAARVTRCQARVRVGGSAATRACGKSCYFGPKHGTVSVVSADGLEVGPCHGSKADILLRWPDIESYGDPVDEVDPAFEAHLRNRFRHALSGAGVRARRVNGLVMQNGSGVR